MATDKLSIKFPKWMKIKEMSETEGICDFLKGKSRNGINFKRLTLNMVRVWSNGLLLTQIPYSCLSVPKIRPRLHEVFFISRTKSQESKLSCSLAALCFRCQFIALSSACLHNTATCLGPARSRLRSFPTLLKRSQTCLFLGTEGYTSHISFPIMLSMAAIFPKETPFRI